MRHFAAAALACAALFLAIPIFACGGLNVCQNVALRGVQSVPGLLNRSRLGTRYDMINPPVSRNGAGPSMRAALARLRPYDPPVISCSLAFWEAL